jgi:hypothetical protein
VGPQPSSLQTTEDVNIGSTQHEFSAGCGHDRMTRDKQEIAVLCDPSLKRNDMERQSYFELLATHATRTSVQQDVDEEFG